MTDSISTAERKPGHRLFYGWWIVIACSTMALFGGGTFNFGMTAFFRPLTDEFHWSQAATAVAFGLRTFEAGIAAPFFGFLTDRFGPRRLLLIGMATAGIAFLLLSQVNSLPTYYLVFLLLSLGWTPASSVVSVVAVARWFRKRISLALGLLAVGTGAGSILVPAVVWLVSYLGWRWASFAMGVAVLAVCVPLTFVVRDRPEDLGYQPYGVEKGIGPALPEKGNDATVRRLKESEYSVGQALRTPDFWFITLAFTACFAMANSVTTFHIPYLESIGISTATAAWVLSFSGVASVAGRIFLGWLGDIADIRYLVAGTIGVQIISLISLATAHSMRQVIIYGIAFGIGWGGSVPLRNAIIVERFGRKALGGIQSLFFGIATVASTASPVFIGRMFDVTQNYRPAFLILAGFLIITGPLVLLVRLPLNHDAPREKKL